MDVLPYVYSRVLVVVKEFGKVYHIGCNECFECITIWQHLHVIEDFL